MNIMTRRAMLGASAAAVTGLTVTPLAMKAAGVKAALAVEPLLALEQEWSAIDKEIEENRGKWSRAFDRLPAWARTGEDQHGRMWGWPDVGDLPEFKDACKAGLSTRPALWEVESFNEAARIAFINDGEKHAEAAAQGDARVRAWQARKTEKADLYRQTGMDKLNADANQLRERQNAVEKKIMIAPAYSFAGIAVKLRLALDHTEAGENDPEGLDWDQKLVFHALRDAECLTGEVAS